MRRRPPRSTLFPYTTLFRSDRKSGSAGMPRLCPKCLLKLKRHNLGNLLLLGKIGVFHNRRNARSEERFSRNAETDLVCRLLLEKKKQQEKRDSSHRLVFTPS